MVATERIGAVLIVFGIGAIHLGAFTFPTMGIRRLYRARRGGSRAPQFQGYEDGAFHYTDG